MGWHAMEKRRLKRSEIRDELRIWEDELRGHEVRLQMDLLDLAEAEKGVEQESAKELNEGFCDLQAAAEDRRRRSMSESAATVAESASGALRQLADELKVGDDGGDEAAEARLRVLCTDFLPLVSKATGLETRCSLVEVERKGMEEKRKEWKEYEDAFELERQWRNHRRSAMKVSAGRLREQAVFAEERLAEQQIKTTKASGSGQSSPRKERRRKALEQTRSAASR